MDVVGFLFYLCKKFFWLGSTLKFETIKNWFAYFFTTIEKIPYINFFRQNIIFKKKPITLVSKLSYFSNTFRFRAISWKKSVTVRQFSVCWVFWSILADVKKCIKRFLPKPPRKPKSLSFPSKLSRIVLKNIQKI